ncbi:MAG: 50S ribosomal protein L9 [Candidatus Anoxychlamydiales bacterium]|nr:50S ribosomal protein L9 [Candidatus Anoxychlamydiales bacterium]
MAQKLKLLLIKDVMDLGKSGEIISVKPGYARNFLFPKQKAIRADKNTIRMQGKLQKERAVKTAHDKKESIELAKVLENVKLSITVKVDPAGHMYGSVGHIDIVQLLKEKNIELDKKNIALKKPIKEVGEFDILIKLVEDVEVNIKLSVIPEAVKEEEKKEKKQPKKEESIKEEEK